LVLVLVSSHLISYTHTHTLRPMWFTCLLQVIPVDAMSPVKRVPAGRVTVRFLLDGETIHEAKGMLIG
jgi:hypothetical protein